MPCNWQLATEAQSLANHSNQPRTKISIDNHATDIITSKQKTSPENVSNEMIQLPRRMTPDSLNLEST
jgi:hypothetical protein